MCHKRPACGLFNEQGRNFVSTRLAKHDPTFAPDVETRLMCNEIALDISEAFGVYRQPRLFNAWRRSEFNYIILAEDVQLPLEYDTPHWHVSHFRAAPQPSLPDTLEQLFERLRVEGFSIGDARLLPSSVPMCAYTLKIRGHEPDISTLL